MPLKLSNLLRNPEGALMPKREVEATGAAEVLFETICPQLKRITVPASSIVAANFVIFML